MALATLTNEIILQRPSTTRDASGHFVRTWADAMTVLAEVRAPTGNEVPRNEGMEALAVVVFRIRYPFQEEAPTVRWRISWESRTYEVAWLQDLDGRKRWLHLYCKEVQV